MILLSCVCVCWYLHGKLIDFAMLNQSWITNAIGADVFDSRFRNNQSQKVYFHSRNAKLILIGVCHQVKIACSVKPFSMGNMSEKIYPFT